MTAPTKQAGIDAAVEAQERAIAYLTGAGRDATAKAMISGADLRSLLSSRLLSTDERYSMKVGLRFGPYSLEGSLARALARVCGMEGGR